MGQRTQAIIKFKDDKENKIKVTYHNQWGYGRILIYAAYAVLKSIETGIIEEEYSFCRRKELMFEKLQNIINVNIEKGIYAGWVKYAEDDEDPFVPAKSCDNNDGFVFLDISDLENPKYAFCIVEYDEKGKEQYKNITAKEYWDIYESWYDDWEGVDLSYVDEWIEYIENHAQLMNKKEIKEYITKPKKRAA